MRPVFAFNFCLSLMLLSACGADSSKENSNTPEEGGTSSPEIEGSSEKGETKNPGSQGQESPKGTGTTPSPSDEKLKPKAYIPAGTYKLVSLSRTSNGGTTTFVPSGNTHRYKFDEGKFEKELSDGRNVFVYRLEISGQATFQENLYQDTNPTLPISIGCITGKAVYQIRTEGTELLSRFSNDRVEELSDKSNCQGSVSNLFRYNLLGVEAIVVTENGFRRTDRLEIGPADTKRIYTFEYEFKKE